MPAMPAAGSAAPRGQQRPLARAPNGAPDLLDVVPDADADADAEPTEDLAVRVAVRARPLVAKERLERARECLSYPDDKSVLLGKNRLFHFDDAYPPRRPAHNLRQPRRPTCGILFQRLQRHRPRVRPDGQRQDVHHGQRKLLQPARRRGWRHSPRHLGRLAGIERRKGTSEISVRCAFLEVHNEEVRDLLHPDTTTKAISIRERADGAIVVSDVARRRRSFRRDGAPVGERERRSNDGQDEDERRVVALARHLHHHPRAETPDAGSYASTQGRVLEREVPSRGSGGFERNKRDRRPSGRGSRSPSTSTAVSSRWETSSPRSRTTKVASRAARSRRRASTCTSRIANPSSPACCKIPSAETRERA